MIEPTRAAHPDAHSEHVLDDLLDEISNKLQAGEPVDVEAYIREHPEHQQRIRQLLQAMELMTNLKDSVLGDEAQPLTSDSLTGQRTLGDYRILREIGRGGMAVVYEAEQVSLGRTVALKVLPFASVMDQQRLQRFKNEAMAAATLDHPNIVSVYSVGCERGVHFYAMQCIEGQTLAKVIGQLRQSAEPGPVNSDDPTGSTPHNSSAESDLAQGVLSGQFPSLPTSDLASTAAADVAQPSAPPQAEIDTGPRADISTERSTGSPAFFRTVAKSAPRSPMPWTTRTSGASYIATSSPRT